MTTTALGSKVIIKNLKKLYRADLLFEDYCQDIGDKMDEILVEGCAEKNRGRIRNDQPQSGATERFDNVKRYMLSNEAVLKNVWEKTLAIWKDYYGGTDTKFCRQVIGMLEDSEIIDCNNDDVSRVFRWIKLVTEEKRPLAKDDIYKALTILTIMSYTRHNWPEIAPGIILLADIKDEKVEKKKTEIEELIEKGKNSWANQDFKNTLSFFDKAKKKFIDKKSSASPNEKGLIMYYLYMIKYREYRESIVKAEENRTVCRQYLIDAAGHGYAPAMLKLAEEYHTDYAENVVDTDVVKCCKWCQQIVANHKGSIEARDAYWILYKCTVNNTYTPPEGENADLYLRMAYESGHPDATEIWRKRDMVSFESFLNSQMDDQSNGKCFFNDSNSVADTIIGSLPVGWVYEYDYSIKRNQICFYKESSENEEKKEIDITDGSYYSEAQMDDMRIFFFISDDYSKNIHELLKLLQNIKNSGKPVDPEYIRIYIRAFEHTAAPIIDTALARMKEFIIPLYILDDDKQASNVLAFHPLFFPIRTVSYTSDKETHLHYVIIGNTRGCEWLLKEAYWMMTFRNPLIKVKITVLGPESSAMYERILYQCPDLEEQSDTKVLYAQSKKDDKEVSMTINFVDCQYNSKRLIQEISPILLDGNVYMSIDTGNDMDNYSMAIRMRQESIRKIDPEKTPERLYNLPVITYRCQDPDIAYLSDRAVVYNQDSGHVWYNNYEIIPYGTLHEQYSFDVLAHNILEDMGYCIHLQYSGIDAENIYENKEKLEKAQKSYYGRTYNRDSSVCVAKSIAYRLFQCHYPDNVKQGIEHILPPLWEIRDANAFYSKPNREYFSRRLYGYGEIAKRPQTKGIPLDRYAGSQLLIDDWPTATIVDSHDAYHKAIEVRQELFTMGPYMKETYSMAEWEHRRWNRYMITRAWTSGSKEDAVAYFRKGNERQQLYIAQIHPAIRDFSEIKALNDYLLKNVGEDYTLVENDISSIQMTESILKMDWINLSRKKKHQELHEVADSRN